MNPLYLLIGLGLLLFAILDILWTTLWVDGGAGPLSSRLSTLLWGGLKAVGGRRSRTLSLAGPLILTATLFVWVAMIWAGWTFLFAADAGSLLSADERAPADWAGRLYFVAYSMFTMGNGDYNPQGGGWQIATSLTTASGMLFVTLGVSYVLSVLGAVSVKRSFASGVTGLGERPEELLREGWTGESFHGLDLPLDRLGAQLGVLAEQHKSYPILHYYHSERSENASAVAVAVLDEALTLLRFGVSEEQRPDPAVLRGARASVDSYLTTLNGAFIEPADTPPPFPDLARLRSAGLPVVSDEAFAGTLADLSERRRKLLGMVRADAWPWPSFSPLS